MNDHPGHRRLLTIGDVGPTLAAIFVAEIGDINRFHDAAALCCWAGITPRHYESNRTVRRGHRSVEPLWHVVAQQWHAPLRRTPPTSPAGR